MSEESHRKTLMDLARRLERQALLARNGGFNPLAERQAAALEAEAQAIRWALEKCSAVQPSRSRPNLAAISVFSAFVSTFC